MTKLWRYVLALALLGAAFAARAPFLSREIWNLDEGSTFTMAVQVRHGGVLYRDAADNRTPLVPYLKAAVFAVAGDWNATAVHVVVALALGGCAIAFWRIGRRLGDEPAGIAAAVLFLLLSNGLIGVHESQAAHTEWFLIFFSAPAFLLFARWHEQPAFGRGAVIGALFGCAALCKQPGLLDLGVTMVIAALLAWGRPEQRRGYLRLLAGELAGTAAVVAATFAYFVAHGALGDFLQYAWWYNTKLYVPEVPLLQRWAVGAMTFRLAWALSPPLLVAACLGALALLLRAFRGLAARPAPRIDVFAWLILGWSASGLLSTMLSGREFSHYAIGAIPGLALASGWALARVGQFARPASRTFRLVALGTALCAVAWLACRLGRQVAALRTTNDFDAADCGVVERFTPPGEPIFVWGYAPETHFFTHRVPSTRFVYSVFLTGMIPWTNVDPLIDTRYAIVPGSWEKFWTDFRKQPPEFIVDAAGQRGFGKYPLSDFPELWRELRDHYVRVRPAEVRNSACAFYLRTGEPAPAGAVPQFAPARNDPALGFTVSLAPTRPRVVELRTGVPADTIELALLRDGVVHRRVVLRRPGVTQLAADASECQVTFLLSPDDARGAFALRRTSPAGVVTSPARPLGEEVARALTAAVVGPKLHFAGREFAPLDAEAHLGPPRPLDDGSGWLAHAPSFLEYERPAAMTSLALEYGIVREAWNDPSHKPTNGCDVLVEFARAGSPVTWERLFTRRLHPFGNGNDQGPQHTTVALPPSVAGRLRLRFAPGPMSDASFDWSWWGRIDGSGAAPVLACGENFVVAREQSAGGGSMRHLGEARWLAHTPAWAVFDNPGGLRRLHFGYGLPDNSWDGSAGGKTDGIVARVVLEFADGKTETVHERRLDPAKVTGDRGPQIADVVLPNKPFRSLRVVLDPGPYNSPGFDWSYLENLTAIGGGPAIVLGGGRQIIAESSDVNREGLMNDESADARVGAHAPSFVTYRVSGALASVDFGYGLFEGAYFDEQGRPRSDGIEVFAEFVRDDGSVRELFRRELTPASRPADRGVQRARVIVPRGEAGRLRFRIGPGPSGSNAFDWAYFTDFRGELAP